MTGLCPWCHTEIFAVGLCLVNGETLEDYYAWRCDVCDTYLDGLGLPIKFDKIAFDLPGTQNCCFK